MKRGAIEHPKMLHLACRLGIERYAALGLVETLLTWASKYSIQGNPGKWPNSMIAEGVYWKGDPNELVDALVETGWLEVAPAPHRLVIHDIKQHADNSWKQNLTKAGLAWWDGSDPRLGQIGRPTDKKSPTNLQPISSETPKVGISNSTETPTEPQKTSSETPQKLQPVGISEELKSPQPLSFIHSLYPEPLSVIQSQGNSSTAPETSVELGEAWEAFDLHWGWMERANCPVVQKPGREKFSLRAAPLWASVLDGTGAVTMEDVRRIFGPGGLLDSEEFERRHFASKVQDAVTLLDGKYGTAPVIQTLVTKSRVWDSVKKPGAKSYMRDARPDGLRLPDEIQRQETTRIEESGNGLCVELNSEGKIIAYLDASMADISADEFKQRGGKTTRAETQKERCAS